MHRDSSSPHSQTAKTRRCLVQQFLRHALSRLLSAQLGRKHMLMPHTSLCLFFSFLALQIDSLGIESAFFKIRASQAQARSVRPPRLPTSFAFVRMRERKAVPW